MDQHVVSEEYLALQKSILAVQRQIKSRLEQKLPFVLKKEDFNHEKPILSQLKGNPVPLPLYHEVLKEISEFLEQQIPEVSNKVITIVNRLSVKEISKWLKGSITFDTKYFETIAENNQLEPWLPHFIAEQAIRPFMQVVGERCKSFIDEFDVMGTCPCCGEPPRIAKYTEEHLTLFHCPRCESEWPQQRHACVHCGEDREDKLFYISIEEDERSVLEVCKTCRNYVKIMKDEEMYRGKQAGLLDLETIHLDFVAQEEGFGGE